MAFCSKCGAQISDGAKFCPSCGNIVETAQPQQPQQPGQQYQQQQYQQQQYQQQPFNQQQNANQNDFASKISALNNTADSTSEYDPKDIESNKAMAIFAYLSILVLVPLLGAKESKFARFHANQGLVLFIAEVIYGIADAVIVAIFFAISWRLASIISTLLSVASLVFFVLSILGIVNVVSGKAKELPLIGKIKLIK